MLRPTVKISEKLTRTYVRKLHPILTGEQIQKHSKAIEVQKELYNFVLYYLEKTYGIKHLGRPYPNTRTSKVYDMQTVVKQFSLLKTDSPRWSVKKIGLHSQVAQRFMVTLYTNFGEYRKELKKGAKQTDEKKARYREKHSEAWYKKGSLGYMHKGDVLRSIEIPNNNTCPITILSAHHLQVQDFGIIQVKENISKYKQKDIATIKIKTKEDGTYELQLTITEEVKRKDLRKAVGLDWGMKDDKVLHSSDNEEIYLDRNVSARLDNLEKEINTLKSKRDKLFWLSKTSSRIKKIDNLIHFLSKKRESILREEYISIANTICQENDIVAMEKLSSKKMRKTKSKKKADNASNKKLTKIKPGELAKLLKQVAARRGTTVIETDPYKTSQVEYKTDHQEEHSLEERTWISAATGNLVIRDYNAALNILDWAMHPENHIKHKEYPKLSLNRISVAI